MPEDAYDRISLLEDLKDKKAYEEAKERTRQKKLRALKKKEKRGREKAAAAAAKAAYMQRLKRKVHGNGNDNDGGKSVRNKQATPSLKDKDRNVDSINSESGRNDNHMNNNNAASTRAPSPPASRSPVTGASVSTPLGNLRTRMQDESTTNNGTTHGIDSDDNANNGGSNKKTHNRIVGDSAADAESGKKVNDSRDASPADDGGMPSETDGGSKRRTSTRKHWTGPRHDSKGGQNEDNNDKSDEGDGMGKDAYRIEVSVDEPTSVNADDESDSQHSDRSDTVENEFDDHRAFGMLNSASMLGTIIEQEPAETDIHAHRERIALLKAERIRREEEKQHRAQEEMERRQEEEARRTEREVKLLAEKKEKAKKILARMDPGILYKLCVDLQVGVKGNAHTHMHMNMNLHDPCVREKLADNPDLVNMLNMYQKLDGIHIRDSGMGSLRSNNRSKGSQGNGWEVQHHGASNGTIDRDSRSDRNGVNSRDNVYSAGAGELSDWRIRPRTISSNASLFVDENHNDGNKSKSNHNNSNGMSDGGGNGRGIGRRFCHDDASFPLKYFITSTNSMQQTNKNQHDGNNAVTKSRHTKNGGTGHDKTKNDSNHRHQSAGSNKSDHRNNTSIIGNSAHTDPDIQRILHAERQMHTMMVAQRRTELQALVDQNKLKRWNGEKQQFNFRFPAVKGGKSKSKRTRNDHSNSNDNDPGDNSNEFNITSARLAYRTADGSVNRSRVGGDESQPLHCSREVYMQMTRDILREANIKPTHVYTTTDVMRMSREGSGDDATAYVDASINANLDAMFKGIAASATLSPSSSSPSSSLSALLMSSPSVASTYGYDREGGVGNINSNIDRTIRPVQSSSHRHIGDRINELYDDTVPEGSDDFMKTVTERAGTQVNVSLKPKPHLRPQLHSHPQNKDYRKYQDDGKRKASHSTRDDRQQTESIKSITPRLSRMHTSATPSTPPRLPSPSPSQSSSSAVVTALSMPYQLHTPNRLRHHRQLQQYRSHFVYPQSARKWKASEHHHPSHAIGEGNSSRREGVANDKAHRDGHLRGGSLQPLPASLALSSASKTEDTLTAPQSPSPSSSSSPHVYQVAALSPRTIHHHARKMLMHLGANAQDARESRLHCVYSSSLDLELPTLVNSFALQHKLQREKRPQEGREIMATVRDPADVSGNGGANSVRGGIRIITPTHAQTSRGVRVHPREISRHKNRQSPVAPASSPLTAISTTIAPAHDPDLISAYSLHRHAYTRTQACAPTPSHGHTLRVSAEEARAFHASRRHNVQARISRNVDTDMHLHTDTESPGQKGEVRKRRLVTTGVRGTQIAAYAEPRFPLLAHAEQGVMII